MSERSESASKREAFEDFMGRGVTALHFDARQLTVRVPGHLRDRPWLVLNYSYRYRIKDLEITARGVQASLSFGGVPHPCWVPWSAVFAISDDQRSRWALFPDAAPAEFHEQLLESSKQPNTPSKVDAIDDRGAPSSPPKRSHLKLVK